MLQQVSGPRMTHAPRETLAAEFETRAVGDFGRELDAPGIHQTTQLLDAGDLIEQRAVGQGGDRRVEQVGERRLEVACRDHGDIMTAATDIQRC